MNVGKRIRVTATDDPELRVGDTGTIEQVIDDMEMQRDRFGDVVIVAWDRDVPNAPALVEVYGDTWEVVDGHA